TGNAGENIGPDQRQSRRLEPSRNLDQQRLEGLQRNVLKHALRSDQIDRVIGPFNGGRILHEQSFPRDDETAPAPMQFRVEAPPPELIEQEESHERLNRALHAVL